MISAIDKGKPTKASFRRAGLWSKDMPYCSANRLVEVSGKTSIIMCVCVCVISCVYLP